MISEADYFHRQIQLWGAQTQAQLADKHVAIIGSGGLGCTLATALGTSGIGKITMVDFDTVSVHNIHRQIAFTTEDEGSHKAECVAAWVARKNPFVKVETLCKPFEAFAEAEIKPDLILDATDNLQTRYEIDAYAKAHAIPWIYASVEAYHGQVCFMQDASFGVFPLSDHTPGGITAPIVMFIGSLQANLALRYLAGLSVKKDLLYYLSFDETGELVVQKFGMPQL